MQESSEGSEGSKEAHLHNWQVLGWGTSVSSYEDFPTELLEYVHGMVASFPGESDPRN